jgi:CrcB protein
MPRAAAARPALAYNRPMFGGLFAVGTGAAVGAWLRWGLSAWLNPRVPHFPLGTLAANLIGGYLVGFAIAFFAAREELPPEVRLFAVTGFLGGLTTFSTFSSEVTQLLLRGEYWTGGSLALAHLAGSLVLTVAGIATFRALAA